MTNDELKDMDPEDIGDLLAKVANSFGITFGRDELMHITTFGQFCDHITTKIELQHADDCTTQQAFYKLRDAISSTQAVDRKAIYPHLSLSEIFPRLSRRARIRQVEHHLGFRINALRPAHTLTATLAVFTLVSCVVIFFFWQMALLLLVSSIGGFWLANKTVNELDLETVGEVAEKMAGENYLKSRRNPNTCNKNEIKNVLTDWFSEDLSLDRTKLTREAKFG